jgi:hypothetical protein
MIPKEGVDRVKNSIGVQSEIEYATNLGKLVKYITIQTTVQEYNI